MGKQGAVSILHVMFVIAQFLRYKRRETIYHRPLSARVAVDTYVCMYDMGIQSLDVYPVHK